MEVAGALYYFFFRNFDIMMILENVKISKKGVQRPAPPLLGLSVRYILLS